MPAPKEGDECLCPNCLKAEIAARGTILDLPPWKRINDLEAALDDAGVRYRRTFDWHDGWAFELRGEVVARGQAIGLLEQDVRRWLSKRGGVI